MVAVDRVATELQDGSDAPPIAWTEHDLLDLVLDSPLNRERLAPALDEARQVKERAARRTTARARIASFLERKNARAEVAGALASRIALASRRSIRPSATPVETSRSICSLTAAAVAPPRSLLATGARLVPLRFPALSRGADAV